MNGKLSQQAAALFFAFAAITSPLGTRATPPGPGMAPTPTPHIACPIRVLIVYAAYQNRQPTAIHNEILEQPDVTAVDLFDASSNAPALALLQQYDLVMAFNSGTGFYNATALGDNLAAYVDGGGVVRRVPLSARKPACRSAVRAPRASFTNRTKRRTRRTRGKRLRDYTAVWSFERRRLGWPHKQRRLCKHGLHLGSPFRTLHALADRDSQTA